MGGAFGLLLRHFFGRFFDNEIVSQQGDLRTSVVQVIGLFAVPGIFLPFYMLPQQVRFDLPFDKGWLLIGDYYFFVMYSMVIMGLVMVFEWDALFPDRKDYLILTPLPLSQRGIFAGKTAALILFLALFVVDANFFGATLGPVVSAGPGMPLVVVARLIAAHATAVAAAALFVALVFAAVQGLLINLLTGRAFRRVSPWVQMAGMGLLVTVLFLTPLVCATLRPVFERGSPLVKWYPPFWFLALYLDLLPGRPGGPMFHSLAPLAWKALGVAGAVFAISYLAGYQRHARRVMESLETAGRGPGWLRTAFDAAVNRWLLRHPLERATFHFISNTILRTPRHRLFQATYAGIALSLAIPNVVEIGTRPGAPLLVFSSAGLLAIPLTLSFFAVSGLRAAFNLPAELRANWVFQVCESEQRIRHIRAARKWVVLMGIVPLFLLLAPLEFVFRGWWLGTIHLTFALALALVLLELLMVWFRKIPFTCSYFPGKTSLAVMALLYIAGFTTYCGSMATLQSSLIHTPYKRPLFYAFAFALLCGLALLERHELDVDNSLIYEDQPDPIVRTLELG